MLPGNRLSPATVAAVGALRASGVAFVPASARTKAGLVSALTPVLPDVSAAICCNGAIGLGPGGASVIWQEFFADGVVADFAAVLSGMDGAGLAVYDGDGWALSPEYAAAFGDWHTGLQFVLPLAELGGRPASFLGAHHPDLTAAELAAVLTSTGLFAGRATITYAADQIVNISPAGADKGTGARRALAALGIAAADAVGFGDAGNDLPLAAALGRFVAVENADPRLLAIADETTGPAGEDGVAAWLVRAGLELELRAGDDARSALAR